MKARPSQLLNALLLVGSISTAPAAVFLDLSPSNAVPPATLGPYQMTPFPLNDSDPPPGSLVTTVPSPLGGNVGFPQAGLQHFRTDPNGPYNVWNPSVPWGHGYGGDVYYANPVTGFPLGVQLPPGTEAFYFYIQPEPHGLPSHGFIFNVYGADGISTLLSTSFSLDEATGAQYIGVFSDSPTARIGGLFIQNPTGYAIGEFGIAAVPEPGTMALFGLIGIVALAHSKWIKKMSRRALTKRGELA